MATQEAEHLRHSCRTRTVVIEKETGTGLCLYKLRIGNICFCVSENRPPMPRYYSDPIQTYALVNKKSFTTIKNPAYKAITIVPGLKLEFPVYENGNPNPIAKMERVYEGHSLLSPSALSDRYTLINENGERPLGIHFVDRDARASCDDIAVSIYPDESFVSDPCSLVEERYIVNIDEKYFQWLHHIFHSFILRFSI